MISTYLLTGSPVSLIFILLLDGFYWLKLTLMIKELNRLALLMLWKQILVCFYRTHANDLQYNGHRLSSPEVLEVSRVIDKLMADEVSAQAKYREAQLIIENGGQL
jgi:hypothetical protein